jgi:uncharacterized membrane protein YsdA (DUF1294 family)
MARYDLKKLFFGLGLTLTLVLSLALWRLGLAPLYAYLGGVNVATLLFYGYDKRQAIAGRTRVPEVVLHAAALLGGSPGALAGQMLFRHKTQKRRFKMVFAAIVLVQIVAVYAYWRFARG